MSLPLRYPPPHPTPGLSEGGRYTTVLTPSAQQSHRSAPPHLTGGETEVQHNGASDSPRARHLPPPDPLHVPYLDSARSAEGVVAPSQSHGVSRAASVRRPGRTRDAPGRRHSLSVSSLRRRQMALRCLRSGCGRWHCPAPALPPPQGVLCPLIRCLLLSLARGWQPLTQPAACGAALARAMSPGACQSPSATGACRSPLTSLSAGLSARLPTRGLGWRREEPQVWSQAQVGRGRAWDSLGYALSRSPSSLLSSHPAHRDPFIP